MPFTVIAISGSLRTGSSNSGLVRMARRLALADPALGLQFADDVAIDSLPFYNADLEDPAKTPESVLRWRKSVQSSDALFIASPEYNYGPTAALKNAIDWASRPPGQHALRGKVISLVSSSASTGGKHMIEQISNVLTLLGNALVVEPDAMFVKGADRIQPDGTTSDPVVEDIVRSRLAGMAEALSSARHAHGAGS